MSVNEKMTAIADAIRAKTGGTDLLSLDAMAAAIAALEVGGGKFGDYSVVSGTFTPASNISTSYQIYTGLVEEYLPRLSSFYFVFLDPVATQGTSSKTTNEILLIARYNNLGNMGSPSAGASRTEMIYRGTDVSADPSVTATLDNLSIGTNEGETVMTIACTSARRFISGKRYTWAIVRRVFTS